ncbi:hypothetical protein RRG08_010585 [Elysia crispata]|uniref:Uncharacterized protein n=1 Tax=Elysia crispata TaxID=231223 RepID=A0AAE0ZU18_9GAST|nr:hypothetical protein RRG08_010585 [Elysia crispata]
MDRLGEDRELKSELGLFWKNSVDKISQRGNIGGKDYNSTVSAALSSTTGGNNQRAACGLNPSSVMGLCTFLQRQCVHSVTASHTPDSGRMKRGAT